jgi:hypothetical protein
VLELETFVHLKAQEVNPMGLTMRERHAIIRELAPRFERARKKERSQMLDEFVQLTGYTRCYAAYVLRNCGKKQVRMLGRRRVVFIPGVGRAPGASRQRRRRYGSPAFLQAVKTLWALSDGLCGKRLVAFIRETVPVLERQGSLRIADHAIREQLLTVSAATLDRLLTQTKAQTRLKGRCTTRPGTLLKYHIPVKTFADWNDKRPGFCEVDLVAHDGGCAFGDYIQTLDLTDVATGWTETRAVKNKAQCYVFQALKQIRAALPFALLGIDSDNGSEFINNELYRYCEAESITFTRSRPYRKNDNCFVEQKNYSVVRKTVGYYRYDTPSQLSLLDQLYQTLRVYTNFFQPVMKLKEKVRTGSKLTRRYDDPKTPYRRLLDHPQLPQEVKHALTAQYEQLNLVPLKRELNRLQAQLFATAIRVPTALQSPPPGYPAPDHPWRRSGLQRQQQPATTKTEANPLQNKPIDSKEKNHNTLSLATTYPHT